jgi:hypothetical protein
MLSRKSLLGLSAVLILVAAIIPAGLASAHERRQVGDLWMVVGWKTEPALNLQPNSLDLRVYRLKPGTDPAAQTAADRLPVTGLEKTLRAELSFGEQKRELEVTARFNDPGAYDGLVIPNTVGDYTFRIYGAIEGTNIDEKFSSADKKFNAVQDTAPISFPAKAMSVSDIAVQLEDLKKTVDANTAAITGIGSAESDSDSESGSNTLAIIALIVGALGVGVGGYAVVKK